MRKFLLAFAIITYFAQSAFALDVYYFYGKPRCMTCKKMETYTRQAVDSLKDKNVKYIGVDLDVPQNGKYVKKYNLYTKSVILSDTKNGKENWKTLDKIWMKVRNEKEFKNYIISEIKQMKGKK